MTIQTRNEMPRGHYRRNPNKPTPTELRVHLSAVQWIQLNAVAEETGMSMTAFVGNLIDRAIRQRRSPDAALLGEVVAGGADLIKQQLGVGIWNASKAGR